MSEKPEIIKPTPISGFPEWLPEFRLEELRMLDRIRATFESYGYCSIETPVVERSNVLLAKGGTPTARCTASSATRRTPTTRATASSASATT